jgi:hypothetical protein
MANITRAPGGGAGIYNYVSIPAGSLDAWKAAKAASGSTPARVLCLGDSVLAGFNSSDWLHKAWAGVLFDALTAVYGRSGEFIPTYWADAGNVPGTPPWANSGTGYGQGNWGYGYMAQYTGNSNDDIMVFTTPYACTDLDIVYFDHGLNNWTWRYAVDGSTASGTTVTLTAASYSKRVTITGLTNAPHVLRLGRQSNDAALYPFGVAWYQNRNAGIQMARIGQSGQQMGVWAWTGGGTGDMPTLLQGKAAGNTGFGFPTQPHLAIIALGLNDANISAGGYAFGVAGYEHTARRLIQALRRGVTGCSIVFLAYSNPSSQNSDLTSGYFAGQQNYHMYVAAMERMAKAYGCVFVNIEAKWGETPVGQGYLTDGGAHPNDVGHADIGAVLSSFLV